MRTATNHFGFMLSVLIAGGACATPAGAAGATTGRSGDPGEREGEEPSSLRQQAQQAEALAQGFGTLDESDPAAVYRLARKLATAPDRAGVWALKDAWPDLRKTATKEALLSTFFAFRTPDPDQPRTPTLHPRLVEVLDLGIKDPNAATQSFALRCLKSIALDDFAEDFGKYQTWRTAMAQRTDANEVLAESVRAFVARAKDAPPERIRAVADFLDEHGAMLRDIPAARAAALDAGWADVLGAWLLSDEATMQAAMRLSSGLLSRREDLEKHVVPLLAPEHHAALRGWAAATLGDARAEWAVDAILDAVRESLASTDDLRAILPPVSRALASLGDPRAVPVLIAALEAEGTSASAQTVGVFALGPLTGVRITTDQTAAWWRAWWEKNRARFPSAAEMDIPAPLRAAGSSPAAPLAGNEGMMPPTGVDGDVGAMSAAMQLSAAFDNDQRFFLIGANPAVPGPAPPTLMGGRKLLLIIPGGDGSASLKPFGQRLHAQALDDTWLVAQLVAPKWDADQFETLVWPTAKSPWNGARFTTEAFADAVVKEVAGRTAIDAKHVYILAWASGGPAGYAALLRQGSPFAGGVMAMSDFAIAKVEALKAARGKRVAIIHAEEDATTPIKTAEVARDWLARSGASVDLARIRGPRGWPEGTMPLLKEALGKVAGP